MYKTLIIDDDKIFTKSLMYMLLSEKYEVQVAHTAQDGLRTCLKELPDLVLLDVELPDGNGLELCRVMKSNPKIKHIPVIILTGTATTVENKITGLESGADDYIPKACVADELIVRAAGIVKRGYNISGY
ncbi:MAG: response regulator [Elusimicrobiales bacterium]|jgi:two-component system phosphate regulon response regulator PhoB